MGQIYEGAATMTPGISAQAAGEVTWDLTLSRQTEDHIEELARVINGTPADVLKLSLALFALAVESKGEGKKIAILDQEGHVDKEITGF
jgi:hypothetical protein